MAGYQRPGWFTNYLFNPLVTLATRCGISLAGSRVLEVRGRKSGRWFGTPVNPLSFDGQRYLVAPRGETQWVRNVRANPGARLKRGRSTESIVVEELPDAGKPPVLREYLRHWKWETGAFFGLPSGTPTDADLARIAPNHPVFRITK